MKKITYFLLMFVIVSCQKDETDTIPAYIQIDSITLNEESDPTSPLTNDNGITDAWVYVNDQLQGVYELPAKFPVLEQEVQTVRIKAGIKANGIASSRIPYPFYASYFEDVNFTPNATTTTQPVVSYLESSQFFTEDFEGIGIDLEVTAISDTTLLELVDEEGNSYGCGVLNDSLFTFEIATDELKNLPQAGAPVFLELDYKSNTQFLVGVYVNYPQSVIQKDLLWITPQQDWNKIYVNLTSTISEGINASSFKVFIGMKRDFSLTENTLSFDNLKVVY
jgi:hypothetical protein